MEILFSSRQAKNGLENYENGAYSLYIDSAYLIISSPDPYLHFLSPLEVELLKKFRSSYSGFSKLKTDYGMKPRSLAYPLDFYNWEADPESEISPPKILDVTTSL